MIEESYVSFDTARMLKEAGFDVPTRKYYEVDDDGEVTRLFDHGTYDHNRFGYKEYSCPTQALAARWLREVHNIFIQLNPTFDGWLLDLFDLKKHQYILTNKNANADSYEQALEDGLQEAIKLIKK